MHRQLEELTIKDPRTRVEPSEQIPVMDAVRIPVAKSKGDDGMERGDI